MTVSRVAISPTDDPPRMMLTVALMPRLLMALCVGWRRSRWPISCATTPETMSGEVEGLRLEWQQAQVELIHCLDRLSDAVADEVRGLQAQLDTARRFIDMAQGRLAQVTGSLNGLGTALGGLDQEMVAIAEELPDMAAARLAFFQQYGAEMAAGDRIMRDAETEIAAMKDRIGALRDRLELD